MYHCGSTSGNMAPRPSQASPVLLLAATLLLILAAPTAEQQPSPQTTPRKNCTEMCGNVSIPYPFGVERGCFLPGLEIVCNKSFDPPRPFVADGLVTSTVGGYYPTYQDFTTGLYNCTESLESMSAMELVDVSVGEGEARVYCPLSFLCVVNMTHRSFVRQVLFVGGPFLIASGRNALIGVGSNADSRLTSSAFHPDDDVLLSCVSRDGGTSNAVACTGHGCCEASTQTLNGATLAVIVDRLGYSFPGETEGCSFGMLGEKDRYNFTSEDICLDEACLTKRFPRGFPMVVGFTINATYGACPAEGQRRPQGYACLSGNSSCVNATDGTPGYRCRCWDGYEGNPYVPTGCQDINECMDNKHCTGDHQTCVNTVGGYDCVCRRGTRRDGQTCAEIFPLPANVAVGAIGGILIMTVLIFIVLLRKEKRNAREFFEKNGGPILEEAKTIKIFKKEELKPFLKSNNLVGKGCFGEVYRGHLGENQLVAIKKPIHVSVAQYKQYAKKKPINVSVAQNEQFANEVIIQSQVRHKNIVRLIGCCLEVDIPMLVYEFVSKGSLDDVLHGDDRPHLDLGLRLRIAAETAEGLAYMHSGTTTTVLHGDVKPANILLNDSYVPKISDFGISKLINKDIAEHTNLVIGDMNYMDPVYLQTGLLTDKSDVYSFGVVLLELISRKKATYSDNDSLVRNFVDAYAKENGATKLFDMEIAVASDMVHLDCIARMAVECLSLNVDQRPEMTNIAERLLMLKRSLNK